MAFDIDISRETADRLEEMGATFNIENIERILRLQYRVHDSIACDIKNRSRPAKVSFHVRFATNFSEDLFSVLFDGVPKEDSPDNQILSYIDCGIYTG